MIQRPTSIGAYQFVVLAALRAQQLIKGCRPKSEGLQLEGVHKHTVMAQFEVAEGKITQSPAVPAGLGEAVAIGALSA